jgi:tol-pal system protein YbgF
MMKKILTICSTAFLLSGCVALQQDMITLERRLDNLEFRNRELQKQNDKLARQFQNSGQNLESSEKGLRSQYAGLSADMQTMQQEVRLLNGRIEEIQYLANRKVSDIETTGQKSQERLDTINLTLSKLDARLSQVEQYLNLGAQGQPQPPSGKGVTAVAARAGGGLTEEQLYADGRKAYDNGELDAARQLFQKFLKEFPKSKNVDNAQFWIGESYYREKWYERAILEYQTVIEKYPNGNKVPAAMLKQGMALQQIGEKPSARLIFEELVKKYPKSSEAAVASKKLKEF